MQKLAKNLDGGRPQIAVLIVRRNSDLRKRGTIDFPPAYIVESGIMDGFEYKGGSVTWTELLWLSFQRRSLRGHYYVPSIPHY